MELFDWNYYTSFIKDVEQHLGTDQINDQNDQLIIQDIVDGVLTTCEEAAAKYADGNAESIIEILDRIQNEYIRIILDIKIYHNDAQRVMTVVGIGWKAVERMLRFGFRDGGMKRAVRLYDMARYCSDYHTASAIAVSLAHHYGQAIKNHDLRRLWWRRYEINLDQYLITQAARNKISDLLEILATHQDHDGALGQIQAVIEEVSKNKDKAQSYLYWHCYFLAKSWYCEVKKDYEELLVVVLEGYKYFKNLPLNHSHAKTSMGASVVHSYNLLYRYVEAIAYEEDLTGNEMPNDDILILRLACAHLNLGNIAHALRLLDDIKNYKKVTDKVELYRSYCLGEFLSDGRDDDKSMRTAYIILDMYCDARAGKYDRYDPAYLDHHIDKNKLEDAREGYMIRILSLLRYEGNAPDKYDQIPGLFSRLKTALCHSTETEVLNFKTILSELVPSLT